MYLHKNTTPLKKHINHLPTRISTKILRNVNYMKVITNQAPDNWVSCSRCDSTLQYCSRCDTTLQYCSRCDTTLQYPAVTVKVLPWTFPGSARFSFSRKGKLVASQNCRREKGKLLEVDGFEYEESQLAIYCTNCWTFSCYLWWQTLNVCYRDRANNVYIKVCSSLRKLRVWENKQCLLSKHCGTNIHTCTSNYM